MGLDIFAQCPTSNKISGEKIPFWRLVECIELNFRILLRCFHYVFIIITENHFVFD